MKQNIVITLTLILGAAVAFWVWREWSGDEHTNKDSQVRVQTPAKPGATAQQPGNDRTLSQADIPKGGRGRWTEEQTAAWLEKHTAGLIVKQTVDPITGYPGGTVSGKGAAGDLGETPPFYKYQLQAGEVPLLLGYSDNRHTVQRYVSSLKTGGDKIEYSWHVMVSYPWSVTSGGLVMPADENPVRRIGIIAPEVDLPAGESPYTSRKAVQVRIQGGAVMELAGPDFDGLVPEPLDGDRFVLLPVKEGEFLPETARVLWLDVKDDGSFYPRIKKKE